MARYTGWLIPNGLAGRFLVRSQLFLTGLYLIAFGLCWLMLGLLP